MRCPPVILLLHSLLILLTISGLPTSGSPASSSLSSSSSSGNKGSHKRQGKAAPQLLVISLDGFRYDYYDHVYLKSLRSLASSGVRARNGIKGVFSTQTFPSHWTIANGLFEESHAIIANTFFDPVTNDTFTKRSNERHWFGGEPIWVTAKKAGKKAGIFFWIGSTVDYGKHNPDHSLPYNESVPLRERVDTVIKWLAEENLDLALLYWHQPDSAGHAYGALSNEVIKELEHIDVELERMLGLMRENELLDNTNIIVLADHGMMNRTDNHETNGIIEIPIYDPEISQSVDRIVEGAVVTHFWTKAGQESEDRLIDHLRRLDDQTGGHFSVYLKEELPSRWHYGDNTRVAPVVAVADPGFQFLLLKQGKGKHRRMDKATHGYDNDTPEMRPLFLASGPDFQQDYEFTETISMVNIYPLMCHLLRVSPAPSNGSFDEVSFMTRHPVSHDMAEDPDVRGGDAAGGHNDSPSSLVRGSWQSFVIIIIMILTTRTCAE